MPKKGRQATRTTPGFTGPFKGAPQPGTLFDVRTLPKTGEEIGPRGYSLNRSRQFSNRLRVNPAGSQDVELRAKKTTLTSIPETPGESHPFGPSTGTAPERLLSDRDSMRRARSKMIDTLARSTVKPEHLKGLKLVGAMPQAMGQSRGILGAYLPEHEPPHLAHIRLFGSEQSAEPHMRGMPPRPKVRNPEQRGPVDPHSEMTFIHELGHHVSTSKGTAHGLSYGSQQEQGREEGFADAYMVSRWRQDPRNVGERKDPRQHTYVARGATQQKFGEAGTKEYAEELGKAKMPVQPRVLGSTVEETGAREKIERPMLDEPLSHSQRVFGDVPFKEENELRRKTGRVLDPQSRRKVHYRMAGVQTNVAMTGVRDWQAQRKARWGAQNRNLGQQWD